MSNTRHHNDRPTVLCLCCNGTGVEKFAPVMAGGPWQEIPCWDCDGTGRCPAPFVSRYGVGHGGGDQVAA